MPSPCFLPTRSSLVARGRVQPGRPLVVPDLGVMRYGKEHKKATRQRIIDGRRFKRDVIEASGVVALIGDTGLTSGAVHGRFAAYGVSP